MAEGQEEPLRRRLCEQGPEHREGRPGTTPGRALELFTGRGTARAQGLSWANRKLAIRKWTVQGNLVHSVLCNHYLCVVPNIFISEKETLYLLSSHSLFSPLSPACGNHQFIFCLYRFTYSGYFTCME